MVCADVITTAGALLAVLAVKDQFASAALSANHARALATTSSASECSTSFDFCNADATCLACVEAYDASIPSCGYSNVGTCDELASFLCCTTASGCEDNIAFTIFIGMAHRHVAHGT